jgi:hypothetical protein
MKFNIKANTVKYLVKQLLDKVEFESIEEREYFFNDLLSLLSQYNTSIEIIEVIKSINA